ncbi:MAG TPA: MFS transporter, partial [Kiloniellales bacterium]|nr:MFS transporter [Kiloniellales bacterium]
FFQRLAPSVMIDPLQREFGLDGAAVGNLSAFYFYAYAGMQVPIGLIVERYGPRRLLTFGALVCAAATAGFALSQSVWLATICRFLVGFGAGFSFVSAITLAARWFPPQRFAQFVGLTMMAGTLGGLLAQGPLGLAVEAVGWRTALLATAGVGIVLAAALWLVVRDWPPGPAHHAQRHESWAGLVAALARVVTRGQNLILCLIGAAMTAPMLAFAGLWGVAWLMQTQGYSRPEAGATTSLLLLGWAVGSPLAGWTSDRLGRRKPVLQVGCLLTLAALLPVLYVSGLAAPLLWLCFALTGAAAGSMSVAFALARSANPESDTGAAFGLLNGAVVASGAVFQPLIGFLLDLGWEGREEKGVRLYSAETFQLALSSLVVMLALALALSFVLREPRGTRSGT